MLSRLPAQWFGPESIKRYSVRFATRLWPDDTIRCSGRITKIYQEEGIPHADLELTAMNQKGETLISGQATVRRWSETQ